MNDGGNPRQSGEAQAHFEQGRQLTNQRRYPAAIAQFEHALRLKPDYAEAESAIGTVMRLLGRVEEAIAHQRAALRMKPDFADAHVSLALALKAQGCVAEAVHHNREAVRLNPRHVVARNNLGLALMQLTQFDEAVEQLEEALRLDPCYARTYQNLCVLARQDRYEFSASQLDQIRALVAEDRVSQDAASVLNFTLGAILEKQQEFDAAFACYQRGNDIRQRLCQASGVAFDAAVHRRSIDATISVFTRNYFRETPSAVQTSVPIFIVGMPRCGSTLVEQIIARHPEAAGAGELRDISRIVRRLGERASYPGCMIEADAETLRELAERYVSGLIERGSGGRRVVDKMLNNYVHLGLIATLFDQPRVIHCRRDAMDVCFSCYATNFNYIKWANRMEDIADFFAQYDRLMRHWRQVLPFCRLEVSYEQLVADQEAVSRQVIEFCGLPWDERCLAFHESGAGVRTASSIQVRQPIYTTSVGRWRNFESHLGTLKRALEGHQDLQ